MLNRTWVKCEHGYDPILRHGRASPDGRSALDSPYQMLNGIQWMVCNVGEDLKLSEIVEIIEILVERGYGRWYDEEYTFNARMGMLLNRYGDGNFSMYGGDIREALECWYYNYHGRN